ncbi:unnamed protein product [Alternaria alternata]
MDSATAQVVLKLQLDDVDAILKTLPKTDKNGAVNSERVAFAALGDELLRKWNNLRGQAFARNIVQEENSSREAYKKLLGEEQQAERDHDLACRLSGKPVPQRPAVQHAYAMYKNVADQKSEPVNDKTLADKDLHSDLTSMQTKPSKNGLLSGKKRLAEDDLKPDLGPNSFKRARVDDAKDEDDNSITPNIRTTTSKKRTVSLDPAIFRENEDGRTKRAKLDNPTNESLLSGHDGTAQTGTLSATCSSCLDIHAACNMLQLPCRNDGDVEAHAYCRECLTRLFECSITDTSHFPPRCCSKIIPIFNCIPFLPSAVFSRFVAKREELEMVDRTYCSNKTCSNWIRPASIVADTATCAECAQKTCVTCKNERHDGLCPEDKDVKKLMGVAKAKRWQTCPKCKEMVELERGCFHIT